MVHLACAEVLELIRNTPHIVFFKFFEQYLEDTYPAQNKYVVCTGSYPLYYFIKGDTNSEIEKSQAEQFLRNFVPNDFNLWTNLETCGRVINGIVQFASERNTDMEVCYMDIVNTYSKYKEDEGINQILGIVSFSLKSRRSQETSLPIKVFCWGEYYPRRIVNPLELLISVSEEENISVCQVGWVLARELEEMFVVSLRVLTDIREKKFRLKFKTYENMETVQLRLMKYLSRRFELSQITFPHGFKLQNMDYHFMPHIRDVSESEIEEAE